jgi:hypothetical protein
MATKNVERPWEKHRGTPDWKDLIPGYAGTLDDDQLAFVQEHLKSDDSLSYWWGFRPGQKRRAAAAVARVTMHGDPDNRAHNVKLVREAGRKPQEGSEGARLCVKKSVAPTPARMGRKKVEGWESEMVRLAGTGMGVQKIARALQAQGVEISGPTVSARLRELKGQLTLMS